MTTRREFLAGGAAAGLFGGCRTLGFAGGSANVPNYWCTWATQGKTVEGYRQTGEIKFAGDQGIVGIRENLNEQVLFRENGGWAKTLYPESRADLNILLDDGWDVGFGFNPYANCDQFGSMILHEKRFPSFTGTPAERLRKLVRAVKDCGWRGLGLWVAPQCPGESWSHREPDAKVYEDLRRKIGWCGEAGVAYLKVDWGAHDGDVRYRRTMSECARELAPDLLVEHCRTWGIPMNGVKTVKKDGRDIVVATTGRCEGDPGFAERVAKFAEQVLPFSDAFRIYDMTEPIFHAQALERTQVLMRLAERTGAHTFINVEDTPYLGAALGQALGIMRASNWPDEDAENVLRRPSRTGEVARAVAWQRLAPPFRTRADFPTRRSEATLTDSWTFRPSDTWYKAVHGQTVPQSAPAVTTRGLGALAEVRDVGDGVPFVLAMRHPNGALAVGALPRLSDEKKLHAPRAEVSVPATVGRDVPIGVLGAFASVAFDCALADGTFRVIARDLAGTTEHDITAGVRRDGGRIVLPGDVLAKIGSEAVADRSEPGTLVMLKRRNS